MQTNVDGAEQKVIIIYWKLSGYLLVGSAKF